MKKAQFLREEVKKMMKGSKRIIGRTWDVPALHMEITLRKGKKLKDFIKNYVIDRYQMYSYRK